MGSDKDGGAMSLGLRFLIFLALEARTGSRRMTGEVPIEKGNSNGAQKVCPLAWHARAFMARLFCEVWL